MMDEQVISVPCKVPDCDGRVHGDTRCRLHGGRPIYEWRTSDFGITEYIVRKDKEGQRCPTQ